MYDLLRKFSEGRVGVFKSVSGECIWEGGSGWNVNYPSGAEEQVRLWPDHFFGLYCLIYDCWSDCEFDSTLNLELQH